MEVHRVKAMAFPLVVYGYESWTIKKAEHLQNQSQGKYIHISHPLTFLSNIEHPPSFLYPFSPTSPLFLQ